MSTTAFKIKLAFFIGIVLSLTLRSHPALSFSSSLSLLIGESSGEPPFQASEECRLRSGLSLGGMSNVDGCS